MKKFFIILSVSILSVNCFAFNFGLGGGTISPVAGGSVGSTNINYDNITNVPGNIITFTNFLKYNAGQSWPSYASLTVTGCMVYPFINGTNAYKPWSVSPSIFVNTNNPTTNIFLFYNSSLIGTAQIPAWLFARTPSLTNTGVAYILEYDDGGVAKLNVNANNQFLWTADDEATYDTTAVFANTNVNNTNAIIMPSGEFNLQYGLYNTYPDFVFFSVSNSVLSKTLVTITGGSTHSGQTGGITLLGIPFGEYVTNNQIGAAGFEAGKINYTATYNQRGDARMGLDLGVYFNTDASGGSMIERMVEMPTYYGTSNNPAGGWSRVMINHWKGTWLGDLSAARHTYNDLPPARLTVVVSTNDTPAFMLLSQGAGVYTGIQTNGGFYPIPSLGTIGLMQAGKALESIVTSAATVTNKLINTNLIAGRLYTNNYGSVIQVTSISVLATTASVLGFSQGAIMVPGVATNYSPPAVSAVAGFVGTVTNTIPVIMVPPNATYFITNNSVGSGDTTAFVGGQIYIF